MRTCLVCGKINNMFQGDPLEFSDGTMICCKCANVIADDINHLWDLKTSKELDNAKNCIIEKAQKNYEAVISKKIIEKINYTVERVMQNLEPHEEVNVYKELFSYIEPIYSLDGKRGKHLDVYEKDGYYDKFRIRKFDYRKCNRWDESYIFQGYYWTSI